jgi:hypothetical protein
MAIILFLILSVLFYSLGILFFTASEVRETTFWKLYFPPFYEEAKTKDKLLVPRKLRDDVRIILSWYFVIISAVIPLIIFNSRL